MPIISSDTMEKLARPHIARAWFGRFDFPDGVKYLTTSTGRVAIDGQEYIGVTDPILGPLVSIGQFDEPQIGQAAAVAIVLSGVSKEFIQSVKSMARDIEGRDASISWAAFDQETEEIVTPLIPLFPRGKMSAPSIAWEGIGRRYIGIVVESVWSSQNFAPGGRWNAADQRRRFANDKGLDFVGVSVSENWQA